ncbi:MAG: hypothetical protein ABIH41_04920 [Nanoarchaeota archaeon]
MAKWSSHLPTAPWLLRGKKRVLGGKRSDEYHDWLQVSFPSTILDLLKVTGSIEGPMRDAILSRAEVIAFSTGKDAVFWMAIHDAQLPPFATSSALRSTKSSGLTWMGNEPLHDATVLLDATLGSLPDQVQHDVLVELRNTLAFFEPRVELALLGSPLPGHIDKDTDLVRDCIRG